MPEIEALKRVPCRCGGKAHLFIDHSNKEQSLYMVQCGDCFMSTVWNRSAETAVKIWNNAMAERSGEWITLEGYDSDEIYQCSECKAEYVLIDGTPKDNDYFYCPHCGARMK